MIPVTKRVKMNLIKNNNPKFYFLHFFVPDLIMSVKDKMNQKIQGKPVFVVSKSYCPFCVKGKNVLKKYNIKPENIEIIEIEKDPDMNEIQVCFLNRPREPKYN